MHVLFLLDYYYPHLGGAETLFEYLIRGLLAKGHTVSLVTTKYKPDVPSVEKQGNLTIYRVGSTRTNFVWYGFWKGCALIRKSKREKGKGKWDLKTLIGDFLGRSVLREKDRKNDDEGISPVDLIWTTTYTAALPARLLGFLYSIKVGITVHELFGKLRFRYKRGIPAIISYLYEKYVVRLHFAAYHAVSWYTANTLRVFAGIPDDRIHMIYNGVDHTFWSTRRINNQRVEQMRRIYGLKDKIVFMYFGHSGPSKGLDVLLDAIPLIAKKYSNVAFILNIIHASRDQEIKRRVQKIIEDLRKEKIPDHKGKTLSLTADERDQDAIILFDGLIKKDLLYKIALSDCIVVPSLSEGFGLAAAEVSSLKKPLLVSTAGALPEVAFGFVRWLQPGSVSDLISGMEEFIFLKTSGKGKEAEKATKFSHIPPKKFYRSDTVGKFVSLLQDLGQKQSM